jgi:hypothetical protein
MAAPALEAFQAGFGPTGTIPLEWRYRMSMHPNRHHDYFASNLDGSFWPAVLVVAAMFVVAAVAWMTG